MARGIFVLDSAVFFHQLINMLFDIHPKKDFNRTFFLHDCAGIFPLVNRRVTTSGIEY